MTQIKNADLVASHTTRANLELRRAAHYARFCPSQRSAVVGHAKTAGEFAAYAGQGIADYVDHDALAFDSITSAFIEAYSYTTELLAK